MAPTGVAVTDPVPSTPVPEAETVSSNLQRPPSSGLTHTEGSELAVKF